ncbi:PKD domain-containing protein [bacterium]|nr:PKD domain-containing protein [bacterium]
MRKFLIMCAAFFGTIMIMSSSSEGSGGGCGSSAFAPTPDGFANPVARLSASATSGAAPLAVTFSWAGCEPSSGGGITGYSFFPGAGQTYTYGSGTTSTTLVYQAAGTYPCWVTVYDDAGKFGTTSLTVTVH